MNKNHHNPFMAKKPFLYKFLIIGMRFFFKIVGKFTPRWAEKMALTVFLTPPRYPLPSWQVPYIKQAIQKTLLLKDKAIKLYYWGSGPTILLVHGWGGRGSQLSSFITPLVQSGHQVVTFDGPAHGNSNGKQSDMFEFASTISAVANSCSKLRAIIAHSFGAACTLLALNEKFFPVDKLVLVGCPADAIWITEDFAQKLSISSSIVAGMRRVLEKRYNNQWTWEDLSLTKLIRTTTMPLLLAHDIDDHEVPYEHAKELLAARPTCELLTTEKQGHRRILRSPILINKSLSFIQSS